MFCIDSLVLISVVTHRVTTLRLFMKDFLGLESFNSLEQNQDSVINQVSF